MQRPPDPTEGGKYLVIKEWGVRFLLPDGLKGDVIYSLGSPVIDPDNNKIQSAKLLLKNESTAGDVCAVTETAQGTFIETAAQVLRVDKDKPFDAERYKGTFKHSVLTEDAYNYHLNYIIPDCAGSSTTAKIEWLQSSLESLQKVGS